MSNAYVEEVFNGTNRLFVILPVSKKKKSSANVEKGPNLVTSKVQKMELIKMNLKRIHG